MPVPPTRILVATDFGDASATAVWMAGSLAARLGARLTVLHAETLEAPVYFTRDQLDLLERERMVARAAARAYTREFAARLTTAAADALVVDGPAADAVLAHMADADLTVLGTHGYRGARRWWLGSVAERVVRGATAPVLVARAATPDAEWTPSRIVHLGAPSHPAAEWAAFLAARVGGAVDTVVAVETCPAATLDRASLVVVPLSGAGATRHLAPGLTDLLTGCRAPVLFVPDASPSPIAWRKDS